MSIDDFLHRWITKVRGHKPEQNGNVQPVPTAKKVERLKKVMEEKQGSVDFHTVQYVQATLEYGVELTRSEYRTLANRNWKIIQGFGVRATRILVLFAAAALALGIFQLKATTTANNAVSDVQHDRRNSIEDKCKAGKKFDAKLRVHISKLPEPEKALTEKQLGFTEELVSTVVPVTDEQCKVILVQAGFEPKLKGEE